MAKVSPESSCHFESSWNQTEKWWRRRESRASEAGHAQGSRHHPTSSVSRADEARRYVDPGHRRSRLTAHPAGRAVSRPETSLRSANGCSASSCLKPIFPRQTICLVAIATTRLRSVTQVDVSGDASRLAAQPPLKAVIFGGYRCSPPPLAPKPPCAAAWWQHSHMLSIGVHSGVWEGAGLGL